MNKFLVFFVLSLFFINSAQAFELKSKEISDGGKLTDAQLYNGFGCTGRNLSPQLYWNDAPADTKSFAINVYDPDAPTGSGWWHWVVFNIPVKATELPSGVGRLSNARLPGNAIASRNDYNIAGFGGVCPPPGTAHRYIFTIYALNVETLPLDVDATPAMVGFNVNAHMIAKATLTATYGR